MMPNSTQPPFPQQPPTSFQQQPQQPTQQQPTIQLQPRSAPQWSANSSSTSGTSAVHQQLRLLQLQYNTLVDRTTPYSLHRWAAFAVLMTLFLLRVFLSHGWYIVCYALGIYQLNLLLAFLTPKFDPAAKNHLMTDDDASHADRLLPTRNTDEFRPFIRRLPEFKFWYSCTRGTVIALFCTMFQTFNVPVFWPILVVYFITLFVLTMRRQIRHMIKYKYVPFDLGKKSAK